MENYLIYLILFSLGLLEEGVAILYYSFIRRGWRFPCAILSMTRNAIWILASAGVFASFLNPTTIQQSVLECVIRSTIHTLGVGCGNYLSLLVEKPIHNKILKLARRKGKKKHWWIISGDRK